MRRIQGPSEDSRNLARVTAVFVSAIFDPEGFETLQDLQHRDRSNIFSEATACRAGERRELVSGTDQAGAAANDGRITGRSYSVPRQFASAGRSQYPLPSA